MPDLYDILVPLEIHPVLGLSGEPYNKAIGDRDLKCSLMGWPARFCVMEEYRYLILRTNCEKSQATAALQQVLDTISSASINLDVGMRSMTSQIAFGTGTLALQYNSVFPAGVEPNISSTSGSTVVTLPIELFTQAFAKPLSNRPNVKRAAEVFADVDFEATRTSKFVLLATALEIMTKRTRRNATALAFIAEWRKAAQQSHQSDDLLQGISNLRRQSITSSILELVRDACSEAGCGLPETTHLIDRAKKLYARRGQGVHAGIDISRDEVTELRAIVRLVLTGSKERGALTGIMSKI